MARPPIHRLCILIADARAEAADSLGALCERWGHDVDFAYDGASAIEAARRLQPDVIFLDLLLPRAHGLEVARQLRRDPAFRSTLMVALAESFSEADLRRAREAGFDDHLAKPRDPASVEILLRKR